MEFEFGEVESIEAVPAQFRGIYKANEAGKYVVDDAHKGVVEAVTGLNKSLKAARLEAKNKGSVDLSVLSDFGATPDEIKASVTNKIKELSDQLANGGKVNVDKIREELAGAHSKDLQKHTARAEALQKQLYTLLVENEATAAIVEAKGVPELLMPFLANKVKVTEEDGKFKVYVVDAEGERRYSGITGQPMTIKELVLEMKSVEKYGRLFESEHQEGGGGMRPKGGQKPPPNQQKPQTANEKIAAGLKNRNRR
jgi:hypothetical protein